MEKRLGKGLEALIPGDLGKAKKKIEELKISEIIPNRLQPRTVFKQEKMEDLRSSVQEKALFSLFS